MSPDSLNLFQQIHLQKAAASLPVLTVGRDKHLRSALNDTVNTLLTGKLAKYGWNLAWGPQVWKKNGINPLTPADNSWYATRNSAVTFPDGVFETYIISISGTASLSSYDWLTEDFKVNEIVDFNAWTQGWRTTLTSPTTIQVSNSASSPYAALGICHGVHKILTHKASPGFAAADSSLFDFVQRLKGNLRVIFTGHSLGGALAPTIALGLYNSGALSGVEDSLRNILVVPAAGFSPGERNLANLFNRTFPQSSTNGVQTWNADFFNTRDIVPQAWCADPTKSERNLDHVLSIYSTRELGPVLHTIVKGLIGKEKQLAQSSGVTYIPVQGVSFDGPAPTSPITGLGQFVAEVAKQHVAAYHDQIFPHQVPNQLSSMSELYQTFIVSAGVDRQNAIIAAKQFPVFRHATKDDFEADAETIYPFDLSH
ncbi:hypothetical protein K461DRAFT_321807 [Myriangium duriaei CBS 260.36]|uniref:Fungal lipase-type domain-containing protein n=1 Tax=Myriangium duriaei CBS 260.36 TaxID=1168546 RepID=A0A9P4J196_9PEZI|nr:hypothetical protein K461DRAFT_321807 [Myriangium duriaei CBS 260.36]